MSEISHLLNKRLALRQPESGYRTAIDAVLLAAACPVKNGESVLDLGCGVGAAGLCVLARVPQASLTGIDIQEDHIDLAIQNAADNDLEANFACADIRAYKSAPVDHVIFNPPYMEAGSHTASPSDPRARALGHIDTDLEDWITCAFDHIAGRGSITLIHRADHIDKILRTLGKRFGDIEIIPLWPKAGKAAGRVIIRARKHSKGPAILHPGLILHEPGGEYTVAAEAVLRSGQAL